MGMSDGRTKTPSPSPMQVMAMGNNTHDLDVEEPVLSEGTG